MPLFQVPQAPITLPLAQQHGLATKPLADITDIWKRPPLVKQQALDKKPERFSDTYTKCRVPPAYCGLGKQRDDLKYRPQTTSNIREETHHENKPTTSTNDTEIINIISGVDVARGKPMSPVAMSKKNDPAGQVVQKRHTTKAASSDGQASAARNPVCPLVVERLGWPHTQRPIPPWHNNASPQLFLRQDESSSTDTEQAWRQPPAKNGFRTDRRVFVNESETEICVSFDTKCCVLEDESSGTSTSDTDDGCRSIAKVRKQGKPRKYKRHSQTSLACNCRQHRKPSNAVKLDTKPSKSSGIKLAPEGQGGVKRGLSKTILRQKSPERKRNYTPTVCGVALDTGIKTSHQKQANNPTCGQLKQVVETANTSRNNALSAISNEVHRTKKTSSDTTESIVDSFASLTKVCPVARRTIKKRRYTRYPISGLVCDNRSDKTGRCRGRAPPTDMLNAITRLTQVCQEQTKSIDQPRTKPLKKQLHHFGGGKVKKRNDGFLSYFVRPGERQQQEHVRCNGASTSCGLQHKAKSARTLAEWASILKRDGITKGRQNIRKYDDIYSTFKALLAGCNNNSNCTMDALESDSDQSTSLFPGVKRRYKPRKGKNNVADTILSSKRRSKNSMRQKLLPESLNAFVSLEDICRHRSTGVIKAKAKPSKRSTCSSLVDSKTKITKKCHVDAFTGSGHRVKNAAQQYIPKMDVKPTTKINTPRKQGSPETERKQLFPGNVRKRKRDISQTKDVKAQPKDDAFVVPEITRKAVTGQNSTHKYPIKKVTSAHHQTQLREACSQTTRRSFIKKIASTQHTKLKEASSQTIRRSPTPYGSRRNSKQNLFDKDSHAGKTNAKPRMTASAESKRRESIRDRSKSYRHSVRRGDQKHRRNAFYRLLASTKYVSYGINAAGSAFQQLVPAKCRTKHCRNAAEILALSPMARSPPTRAQGTMAAPVSPSRRTHCVDMKRSHRKPPGGDLNGLVLPGGAGGNVCGDRTAAAQNSWSFWSPSASKTNTATDITANVSVLTFRTCTTWWGRCGQAIRVLDWHSE